MKLKAVIFDMDGTLTRTNQLIYDSFNHVAERYIHKRLTPEEIVSFFGPPEQEAVEKMIGAEHIEEAMKEYYDFYRLRHNELASLYPGMRELLGFLRVKEIFIALFTGKGRRTTAITLEQFGIERYFDMVVTGDDVDEFKPSGEGIRKVLSRYSLSPDEALMVGDSVADVRAARQAGVKVAAVLWDSYGKEDVLRMKTDYMFHNVAEFHQWLEIQLSTNGNQ